MSTDEAKHDALMYVDITESTKLLNIPVTSPIQHLHMCGENSKNLL